MKSRTKIFLSTAFVVLAGVLAAYFVLRPDSCDGLPRDIGACSSNRPTYSGTSCAEVAEEWGKQLDTRVVAIINGPADAQGKGRSSRLLDVDILTTQLANKYLRDTGLTAQCQTEEFLATGEAQFSQQTKDGVGLIMFEGEPEVEYSEWRGRLEQFIDSILSDPDLPYAP